MNLSKLILVGYAAFLAVVLVAGVASAQTEEPAGTKVDTNPGLKAIGAGLAVGLAGIGAGLGEQGIGAAAVGAMAEDPKFFGRGLLMTVIPETIVIFGLVVSLILLFV